jgi:hypothetical protein
MESGSDGGDTEGLPRSGAFKEVHVLCAGLQYISC